MAIQTRRYFDIDIALAMMHVCWLFGCSSEFSIALYVAVHWQLQSCGGDLPCYGDLNENGARFVCVCVCA